VTDPRENRFLGIVLDDPLASAVLHRAPASRVPD
jgi:hypothetical protein